MKNCVKQDLDKFPPWEWEFKKDFEKSCIQNMLAKVVSVAMLIDSNDIDEEEIDILEIEKKYFEEFWNMLTEEQKAEFTKINQQ